jgi:DNA-binding NtrC family response regulator
MEESMSETRTSAQLSVLLVDDEPIVGLRLKPALEKNGYRVETLEDGGRALQRIAEEDFDIVVTDIYMEPVDGFRVLEAAVKKGGRTQVIVITQYATAELAREALAKGAFDVIAKPLRPNDLRDAISAAVRARGADRP